MRIYLVTASLMAIAAGGAYAASETQTCVRGQDERRIDVLTPGEIGAACDLKYVRDGGSNVSVPYHADNSEGFCAERARDLVQSLRDAGYECNTILAANDPPASIDTAAAESAPANETFAAGAPDAQTAEFQSVEVAAADSAPQEETLAAVAAETQTAQSRAAEVAELLAADADTGVDSPPLAVAEAPAVPSAPPIAAAAAPVDAPDEIQVAAADVASDTFSAEAEDSAILEQPSLLADAAPEDALAPASTVASRGPVALATTNASLGGAAAPRASVVGRLVGASAEDTPVNVADANDVTEERLAPAPEIAAPTAVKKTPAKETKLAANIGAPPAAAPIRSSEEVIKSVLAAQVAAWNEGNLDAFMGGYWNSPELRFVSGTTVSKGFNQTMKRYRDRYGDGALGRLSFDALDVELVSDDVAVVVGRFALNRGGASDAGAFTLVMKRFDGLWRIVHDHTVEDSTSTN